MLLVSPCPRRTCRCPPRARGLLTQRRVSFHGHGGRGHRAAESRYASAVAGHPDGRSPASPQRVAPMPTIALGKYRISRIVAGSNPFWATLLGQHTDQHMNTSRPTGAWSFCSANERDQRTSFPRRPRRPTTCVAAGTRREDASSACTRSVTSSRGYRPGSSDRLRPPWRRTDRLFAEGKSQRATMSCGSRPRPLAGVSAHNPDCISRRRRGLGKRLLHDLLLFRHAQDRQEGGFHAYPGHGHPFFKDDPKVMTAGCAR